MSVACSRAGGEEHVGWEVFVPSKSSKRSPEWNWGPAAMTSASPRQKKVGRRISVPCACIHHGAHATNHSRRFPPKLRHRAHQMGEGEWFAWLIGSEHLQHDTSRLQLLDHHLSDPWWSGDGKVWDVQVQVFSRRLRCSLVGLVKTASSQGASLLTQFSIGLSRKVLVRTKTSFLLAAFEGQAKYQRTTEKMKYGASQLHLVLCEENAEETTYHLFMSVSLRQNVGELYRYILKHILTHYRTWNT